VYIFLVSSDNALIHKASQIGWAGFQPDMRPSQVAPAAEMSFLACGAVARVYYKSTPHITTHMARVVHQILSQPDMRHAQVSTGIALAGNIIALVQGNLQSRSATTSYALRRRLVGRAEELIRSRLDNPPRVTEPM
jgi:hypothetical protein